MSGNIPTMEWWLEQLEAAGRDAISGTLGAPPLEIRRYTNDLPKFPSGSYISLVGDACAAQIGIGSDAAGAARIAGMMLGMEEGEEPDEETVTDAICELANVLGGVLKSRVVAAAYSFQLGLPVFVRGHLSVPASFQSGGLELLIDGVPAQLLVLKSAR